MGGVRIGTVPRTRTSTATLPSDPVQGILSTACIEPILVFDGGFLPMKSEQEVKHARSRNENLERARKHEATGNSRAAFDCYQKAHLKLLSN